MEEKEKKEALKVVDVPGKSQDDDEIDLYQIWRAIKRRIWTIIFVGLVGASIAAGITVFLIPVKYTSSSLMLVLTKETTLQSIADLQIGTSLTNDYKILIQSRPVLETVIKNLDLDESYRDLRSQITVTNQDDTRILQIDVEDTDPQMAKKIVDELSNVASDYIGDKMEITPPKVIEEGELPTQKTSPSTTRNVVIGFLVGALIAVVVVIVNEMMNDAITTEEDVEQYLGLVTLASLPDKTTAPSGRKSARRKKNAAKRNNVSRRR